MNDSSEAYYQLRYAFTLYYLFLVYKISRCIYCKMKYIRPLKRYGNPEKISATHWFLIVFLFFCFIMKLEWYFSESLDFTELNKGGIVKSNVSSTLNFSLFQSLYAYHDKIKVVVDKAVVIEDRLAHPIIKSSFLQIIYDVVDSPIATAHINKLFTNYFLHLVMF